MRTRRPRQLRSERDLLKIVSSKSPFFLVGLVRLCDVAFLPPPPRRPFLLCQLLAIITSFPWRTGPLPPQPRTSLRFLAGDRRATSAMGVVGVTAQVAVFSAGRVSPQITQGQTEERNSTHGHYGNECRKGQKGEVGRAFPRRKKASFFSFVAGSGKPLTS